MKNKIPLTPAESELFGAVTRITLILSEFQEVHRRVIRELEDNRIDAYHARSGLSVTDAHLAALSDTIDNFLDVFEAPK